jgi:TolB-like protein/Flp pilus assembly protein TadD
MTSRPMTRIFLSYAREERDRVQPFVDALEASGLSVWWDSHIHPGASWDAAIERELEQADWVVALWTQRSVDSRWVRTESMAALERDVLVPVLLDDVIPPVAFRTTQAADLRDWRADTAHVGFDQLVARLTGAEDAGAEPAYRAKPPARRHVVPILIGVAIVAALLLLLPQTAGWFPTSEVQPVEVPDFEGEPAIAVLPFEHADTEDDRLFAEGLTDEIIHGLQQYRSFPVISRHASFAVRESERGVTALASELGASYLVTGSVRRAGDRLRVVAGVVAADGRQLWSRNFDVEFERDAIFSLQDEIAQQIAGTTYPQLLASEIHRVADRNSSNLEAWDHLMKAVDVVYQGDTSHADDALFHIERALELDPDLAEAYWARGELGVYLYIESGAVGAEAEAKERALMADFRKALEISPFDGAACGCLGYMHVLRGELDDAKSVFDTALAANPSSALLRANYVEYLLHVGRLDDARREGELSIRLDPISPFASLAWSAIGRVSATEGDLDRAISETRRALQLDGTETTARFQLPLLLYLDDQLPQAEDTFADLLRDAPQMSPYNRLLLGLVKPFDETIRAKVAEQTRRDQTGVPAPEVLAEIFRALGWQPAITGGGSG